MKRLVLATMSVSALFAAVSYAAPQSVQVSGNVDPVCAVTGLHDTTNLHVGQLNTGSATTGTIQDITVTCNYASGATVTLTSSNQGLKSTDPTSTILLDYTASLAMGGSPVSLDTSVGNSASANYAGSASLAAGVTSDMAINVPTGTVFAGDYTDTLTITVAQQ
ncbi:hypothetical protein [Enterovibrio nigricans]|uniref:Spore coat protein U (SCPU) domain-containing protein n=1 Tax=Enterovibrio nigricans DSM 22720 TaxID=1121868 RepID=A0A1T4UGE4_9GAMM|nr:hypothetical protein [Enterovibrio nigricans]PKF51076.1 hypothetical protein AT251_06610 [Enterovibrio nigricans]SKA51561.1 hypothetical protein SAMN02745132_01638 [Enterovibrio nigricans DSM 22720]